MNKEDHDILIGVAKDVDHIKKNMQTTTAGSLELGKAIGRHLEKHHPRFNWGNLGKIIGLVTVVGGGLGALISAL